MTSTGASGPDGGRLGNPGNLPARVDQSSYDPEGRAGGWDDGDADQAPPVPQAAMLDVLVDAVVDRIEQRVIDELERRGRRQSWGAF